MSLLWRFCNYMKGESAKGATEALNNTQPASDYLSVNDGVTIVVEEPPAQQPILPEAKSKTLLENFSYNAFMTFLQDLPQTISTIVVMMQNNLKEDPDNPTGVSLPGKLDLIPQIGNTFAGLAAGHEANRLIKVYKENPTTNNFVNAFLYSVFSISTVLNGLTNSVNIFRDKNSKDISDKFSEISTFVALAANFLILCKEEAGLLKKLCASNEKSKEAKNENVFHLVCSLNLNLSIVTAFLATTKSISHNMGAYGYIWGTWLGQVPELIPPIVQKAKKCCFG